ncbi:hypothetical protein CAC42_7426 [Sphaceloma murrayae]|uniref:Uncharacterized protein n=1 Tax=Sphaceloma murrayae TaxID=2082308 RepID=A0A2K1QWZ6_9PEZI|nr:hypothetical protein CAC42_7426 [Sphaceloma murrayae]
MSELPPSHDHMLFRIKDPFNLKSPRHTTGHHAASGDSMQHSALDNSGFSLVGPDHFDELSKLLLDAAQKA